MARPPSPKNMTKAERAAAKADLKAALKKSAETLVPFKAAASAAEKAVAAAKKALAKAEADAGKANAKLEKAKAAHATGVEKINAKLATFDLPSEA